MKNYLSILKLILAALWFVSGLACGSPTQNSANISNVSASNTNSKANVPANNASPKTSKKDPKEVCAYLPEFPTGEYKSSSGGNFSCESKKEEKLSAGKKQVRTYLAVGTSGYIKWVQFGLTSTGTEAENLKGEKSFVETMEKFWQKAFAAPLPDNVKEALLENKGKRTKSYKKFTEPINVTITHVDTGDKVYGLQIEVDMCDLCQ